MNFYQVELNLSLLIISISLFLLFTEATIRFLKAKLRVMQEELDRVVAECNKKVHKPCAPFEISINACALFEPCAPKSIPGL